MALKKLLFRPGVNRENTRYAAESIGGGGTVQIANTTAGWYDCDKIRFRAGTPEKLGGWAPFSTNHYLGVCRSLWNWITLGGDNLIGVGTNLKFYVCQGGQYYDITPLSGTATLTNPFSTTSGSALVTVTDVGGGFAEGDFVSFSGATAVGGLTIDGEYQISNVNATSYVITASSTASSTATGGGTVTAEYQINVGPEVVLPLTGWGAGGWGTGTWGVGTTSTDAIRLWSQSNFGQILLFCPRGGGIYYWDPQAGVTTRGALISSMVGATDVPEAANLIFVSDVSRFVFALGCYDIGGTQIDPMLIRWSDQESLVDWSPTATNQAGSLRLSQGSHIMACLQSRQELLVWTDAALYSLQYQGATIGWGATLVGENVSLVGQNAAVVASGVTYWMGVDKFYKYDGRTQTLRCDLRQYIFSDINMAQFDQVCCGTNEGFNEVWWFYCSQNSTEIDKYAVYNYAEDAWYYGTMGRTAWLDSGLQNYPIGATYAHNIVNHEYGVDDNEDGTPVGMDSFITSAEFDLDDGHQFMYIWRMLPDVTFRGSTADSPQLTMTLLPLKNSGAGYTDPASVGGSNSAAVVRTATIPIEQFTGQVYTRVRARQLSIKVECDQLGATWQLGAPRIDVRPDGRR
jgi:hypothetical protein